MTLSHFNYYQSSYNNPQFQQHQQQFSLSQSPQYGSTHPIQHYSATYPSTPHAITYPSAPGDKILNFAGTSGTRANTSGTGGNYSGQQRVGKSSVGRTQGNGKVLNKEELEFLADPAKAVLMANLSSYGSYVLFKVPISDNTNMLNQSVQEMSYSEPSHFMEHSENKIHSDSNIITYSQYLIESQNAAVQDTNSSAQQDALIFSVFEQLSNQKNAPFKDFEKEINNLKQTLFEQSKEKELLTKTFNVFKNESKEKEAKNIDTKISLEKKVKELDNMKAQQIRPMLYDGNVISKETNVISIADSEETLMLKEESRSKML
ncbi:hypothetical protein Tco_1463511 [Tanacetum coccineum]